MATTTTNLGLIEPAGQDRALVANINSNSEKIDAEAGKARANFALVQNGDTATQAISQGQLVVWKGALKKATANIASGATLSNSNLTDDSIATEIASLNSNIPKYSFLGGLHTDDVTGSGGTSYAEVPMPSGANTILAIVPLAASAMTMDDTQAVFTGVIMDTRRIYVRSVGTRTQKYSIQALVIYT